MVWLLLLALLAIFLFGGLGIFVAKVFLIGLAVALIITLLGGVFAGRRRGV